MDARRRLKCAARMQIWFSSFVDFVYGYTVWMLFDEHFFEKFSNVRICTPLGDYVCVYSMEKRRQCAFSCVFVTSFASVSDALCASSTRSGRRGVKVRTRALICDSIRTGLSEKNRRTDDGTNHGGCKGLGFD